MSQKANIECKPNGPYVVKGLAELMTSAGNTLPVQAAVALCRCGGSSNKPFCDGTHQRNGFSSARLSASSAAQRADYRRPGITIHDDRALCAHAGRCTDGLPAVFRYGSEPWIEPNGAEIDAIVRTIQRCPSGALSYTLDSPEAPVESGPLKVAVTKNGPYEVVGGVEVTDGAERLATGSAKYTLCRCGGSKNKPFCDGTHWSNGFTDDKN